MRRFLRSVDPRTLMPYFLLAVAVILAYKAMDHVPEALAFLSRVWSIITPFFYGFLMAYILNIPCCALQRLYNKTGINFIRKHRKGLGILSVYLIMMGIIALVVNLIAPIIRNSFIHFSANYRLYYDNAQGWLNSLEFFGYTIQLDLVVGAIQEFFSLEQMMTSLQALSDFSTGLFKIFLTFVSSIYILFERDKFKRFMKRTLIIITSKKAYEKTLKYADDLNHNFKQYIYTQTIDGLILGTIVTLQLTYIIRSPYALMLGIMLGVVNYIPYFGSIFGSLAAVIVVMLTQGFRTAALAALILLITQQIDGNFIQPKLMGGSFSLSPLLIIISVTVGGAFAGVLGMVAAIPIVAVLKDILEDITVYYEHKRAKEEDEELPLTD
ncbi:MAG: AI-2E family transporter [Oscillospiraceae bacterium]|nr:AI-2E family transporter [Oscillospiraceae bacterium]